MIQRDVFFKALQQHLRIEAANAFQYFGSMVGDQVERLAMADDVSAPTTSPLEESTPAWRAFSALFEYGVHGIVGDSGSPLAEDFYDQFAADTRGVDLLPEPVHRVYMLSTARHVLDGGEREYSSEVDIPPGYLTVAEVALLADMDVGSVRNAMSRKLADPLQGEQQGNRTFVPVPEARRWLAGRKGFTPTKGCAESRLDEAVSISLSRDIAHKVHVAAQAAGLSVEQFIARHVAKGDLA